MSTRNGTQSGTTEALFAVAGNNFAIMPYSAVSEMLAKNEVMQAKENLTAGPIFRMVSDAFRSWSKLAEPGWTFLAPEAHLIIIRISSVNPFHALTKEAKEHHESLIAE